MGSFHAVSGATHLFARRGRRGVLIGATLVYLLALLLLLLLTAALFGGQLLAIAALAPQVEEDPLILLPALLGVLGWLLAAVWLYWLAFAAWEAAALRWLIRGERGGLLGLKLDRDLLNIWLCQLTFLPVGLLIYAAGGLVFAGGWIARNALGGGLAGGLVVFVCTLLAIVVVLGLFLKFLPASALSVARRRYAFFESWGATRGRTLDLLGGVLLLVGAYLGVALLLWIVQSLGILAIAGPAAVAGDPAALAAAGPAALLFLAALAIASMVLGLVYQLALWGLLAALAKDATPTRLKED